MRQGHSERRRTYSYAGSFATDLIPIETTYKGRSLLLAYGIRSRWFSLVSEEDPAHDRGR